MDKVRLPRNFKVYIPLIILFALLTLLMPRTGKFNYDYKKGSPWMDETLIAQFDFPVLKTEAELQDEREAVGSGVIPYYRYSEDVRNECLRSAEAVSLGKFDTLRTQIQEILSSIYSRGIISDLDDGPGDMFSVIYIQRDKRASKYPVSEIYKVSEARAELASGLRRTGIKCDVDSLCRYSGLYGMIVPNLVFDQHFDDLEAFNACLHPFIRNTVGCMEFGGTFLNKRYNRTNDGGTTRRTTDVFQLATAVLFQNPIQNFAITPNNLTDAPRLALDFLKEVPTTWDETVFLDGYPGKYCVLARRHGDRWYIAGINAQKEPLKLKLALPMLREGDRVAFYSDTKSREPQLEQKTIQKPAETSVTIQPEGGIVLIKD